MSTPGTLVQSDSVQDDSSTAQWSRASCVAFRFCFVYFGLYCLTTQILTGLFPISGIEVPDPATLWPMRQIVTWAAIHVFGVHTELVYFSGSGDKTFDWVLTFCLLVLASAVTVIWSLIDRDRREYVTLYKWFRVFIRFCLAGQMFGYGLAKAIPLQMPFPSLARLVEPYGNFSPMGVLWASIGSAPAYEIFAGCAETLAGILLIFPRTTTLGALICLADMVQVFMLNMTYDVPVKLFSFHLILLCMIVLAPDLQRLANFFFLNRTAAPSNQASLFSTIRRNRIALVVQVLFGLLLLGMNLYGSWTAFNQYRAAEAKSVLYGIWEVDQMSIGGQIRSPLLTDYDRWRRIIFELPSRTSFQRMDDSIVRYHSALNARQKTLELTRDDDKNWKAHFTFERPAPDQLILDGDMDDRRVRMELKLLDTRKFLLVSRGFRWIQENPFNR